MKITIITAVYNASATLEKTIRSVLSQSYKNIEYLVMDGASTDGSVEIAKAHTINGCQVFSQRDYGLYDALNKGVALSSGDIIGILNADDVYAHQDIVAEVVEAFMSNPSLDCIYGDLNYVRGKGNKQVIVRRWISSLFTLQKLYFGWMPPHPTLFLRRRVYERVGGFDLSYKISGDYDFILRVFKSKDLKVMYIPKLMVNMQLGGVSNRSFRSILIKMIEDYKIIKKNELYGMVTLGFKNIQKIKQFDGLQIF